jgi:hypothetical protein
MELQHYAQYLIKLQLSSLTGKRTYSFYKMTTGALEVMDPRIATNSNKHGLQRKQHQLYWTTDHPPPTLRNVYGHIVNENR